MIARLCRPNKKKIKYENMSEHISDINKKTGSPDIIFDHRINFNHNFRWNKVILDSKSSQ